MQFGNNHIRFEESSGATEKDLLDMNDDVLFHEGEMLTATAIVTK